MSREYLVPVRHERVTDAALHQQLIYWEEKALDPKNEVARQVAACLKELRTLRAEIAKRGIKR